MNIVKSMIAMPEDNKKAELEIIAEEIKRCTKCPLYRNRKNAVPGEGDPNSEIMFIGEAPGYHEDIQGRPFVGSAGKLLTKLINDIGLSRDKVFITNVVKCRPPNNRDPMREEIEACKPYLLKQIEIIKPRIIVTLGRHSTLTILNHIGVKVSGISSVRGKIFEAEMLGLKIRVIPVYHPAAALYNPGLKKKLEEDFKLIKLVLTGEYFKKRENITLDNFF